MILTISTTHAPATDLGHLLHKHPDRAQSFDLSIGTAHVFYPEATPERTTAALLLEVDALELARGSGRKTNSDFTLGQYVNDRPYAASSLLAVALKKVFSTAAAGVLKTNQALADTSIPLEIHIPALPCRGGAALAEDLFSPLGWEVTATPIPLDDAFQDWGDSRFVDFRATGILRLADALSQLYILLPVLDDAKHYWVGADEIDKLIRHGEGWLGGHPSKDLIAHRYLAHRRYLVDDALARLVEVGDEDPDALDLETDDPDAPQPAQRVALRHERRDAIVGLLTSVSAHIVADVGCGDGALLASLLNDSSFQRILGTDVSSVALGRAHKRLNTDRMSERQASRLELFQSSATYRDKRLDRLDAMVLMEVIEHVDWDRLPALVSSLFGQSRPRHVVVSTPNRDYNVVYQNLATGGLRHPDHRWELSREEFVRWADGVCGDHGYTVAISGAGEEHAEFGKPTQIALFSRVSEEATS